MKILVSPLFLYTSLVFAVALVKNSFTHIFLINVTGVITNYINL